MSQFDVPAILIVDPTTETGVAPPARTPCTAGSAEAAGQSPANPASGVALAVGMSIWRTATSWPGSTRRGTAVEKMACCRVMPAVPGPKLPDVAWFSIRSVLPSSVAGFARSRTEMATLRAWSPSMMSSLPRPSIRSLPPPPRRMLPSAHTVPELMMSGSPPKPRSGQYFIVDASTMSASDDGNVVTNLFSPAMRATPAGSRASQPANPPGPTTRS